MDLPKLPKPPKLNQFPPPGPGEFFDFGRGIIDAGGELIDRLAAGIGKIGEVRGHHPDKDKLIERLNKEAREAKDYLRR